jgi:hypothetical protein
MKTSLTLLLLVASVIGCKTPDSSSHAAKAADYPCNCGTPEAAFEACLNPLCAKGQNNPANPDCVCGKMTIGEKK